MTAPVNDQGRAAVLGWQQTINAAWQRRFGAVPPGRPDVVAGLPVPPGDADRLRDYHADDLTISDQASEAAKNSFGGTGPEGTDNGGTADNHRDAFRHAYWNAMMAREFGEHNAADVGVGHEMRPDVPGADPRHEARAEAMDLYNNKIGREIARSLGPDASDEDVRAAVEQAVRDGKLVMFNENRTALVPSRVP